jgi:hypothetical protein
VRGPNHRTAELGRHGVLHPHRHGYGDGWRRRGTKIG